MVTACYSFVNAIMEQSHFLWTNIIDTPFQNGLPKSCGTTMTILVSNPEVSGEFYEVNNRSLFMSTDSGLSWRAF